MDCYWYINSWRQPPLMGKLSLIHQERCFKLIFVSINGSKVFRMRQIWTRCHLYSGKISCTCWHCKLGTFVNKITIVWDNSCNLCCHTIGRFKYFLVFVVYCFHSFWWLFPTCSDKCHITKHFCQVDSNLIQQKKLPLRKI